MSKKVKTSKKDLVARCRRMRATLKFMKDYFALQESCSAAGLKSKGISWRKVYQDVSEMAQKWCDRSLKGDPIDKDREEE